jgi:hypothetical protein
MEDEVERASDGDLESDLVLVIGTTWYSDAVWSVSSLKESDRDEHVSRFNFKLQGSLHSEDVSTQTWSSGKVRSLSPYLGGPFPRKDGFWPCRKETSSDLPGAGMHSRPDRWQRRHLVPDLSPTGG